MKVHLFHMESVGLLNEYSNWAKNILKDYPDVERYRLPKKRPVSFDNQHPEGLSMEIFWAWSVDKFVTLAKHYRKEIKAKKRGQPIEMYTSLIAQMVQMRMSTRPNTESRIKRSEGQKKAVKSKAIKASEQYKKIFAYLRDGDKCTHIARRKGIDLSVSRIRQLRRKFISEGKL